MTASSCIVVNFFTLVSTHLLVYIDHKKSRFLLKKRKVFLIISKLEKGIGLFLFIESSSLIQIVVNSNQNRMILLYPSYYKYGMY